ncbi:MAG: hypothetical protein MR038_07685, partial [Oscillospiraceae bacterium]|nr:hypothetical protein [Oscillospiraceae bacterium]
MAGAMAVSAMATTASAWTGGDADQAQIVLSYDLNKKGSVKTTSTVTVSFTFADNKDTGYIVKGLDANHEVNSYVGCLLSGDDIYYKLTGAKISATAMDNVTKDTWGIYSADDLAPAWSNAVNNVMHSTKDVV